MPVYVLARETTAWGIWRQRESILLLLPKIVIFFLTVFLINVLISRDFMALNSILNQNGDAVTYLAVMRLLENKHSRKWNALVIQINQVNGLMWLGH